MAGQGGNLSSTQLRRQVVTPSAPWPCSTACLQNSNEVGVFAKLTNAYCLVALGAAENFYSVFEAELAEHIPVIKTSIAGTRLVGRMCVGECGPLARCGRCRRLRSTTAAPDQPWLLRSGVPLLATVCKLRCRQQERAAAAKHHHRPG